MITTKIATSKLYKLKQAFTKLEKVAKKLGFNAPVLTISNDKWFENVNFTFYDKDSRSEEDRRQLVEFTEISYNVETYQIPNYKFLGTIDIQNQLLNGNLPESQRHFDNSCEHCKMNRQRNSIIVLQHTDGHIIRVGKSCLKDFVGINGEHIMNFASLLQTFVNVTEELPHDDYYSSPGYRGSSITLDQALQICIDEINEYGYTSKDYFGERVTKHAVWSTVIDSPLYPVKNNDLIEKIKKYWLAQDDSTIFNFNMKSIINSGIIDYRTIGFIAYAYKGYLKSLYIAKKKLSDYIGAIGDKIQLELKYIGSSDYETEWGYTYIYRFEHENNLLIWKTNKIMDFEVDEMINLKGTIKDHNEYRGAKQTILTRCKIISQL